MAYTLYVDGSIEAELPERHAAFRLDQRASQPPSPRILKENGGTTTRGVPSGAHWFPPVEPQVSRSGTVFLAATNYTQRTFDLPGTKSTSQTVSAARCSGRAKSGPQSGAMWMHDGQRKPARADGGTSSPPMSATTRCPAPMSPNLISQVHAALKRVSGGQAAAPAQPLQAGGAGQAVGHARTHRLPGRRTQVQVAQAAPAHAATA